MTIDEKSIGIVIIYIVLAIAIMAYSVLRGRKLSFLICEVVLFIMLYNIVVYSLLPIEIQPSDNRVFGIKDQINYSDINEWMRFRFWSEHIKLLSSFCCFTFIAAVMFPKMSKVHISLIMCNGFSVAKIAKILILNKKAGQILEMIELQYMIGIFISCCFGYLCYAILFKLAPTPITKIRIHKKRRTQNDNYEMSDI